ncbi:calcium-binding protein [Actinomycetospora atypica]|uniref:Calcium-binding protein n=1 Tax=Actinomycetospora atypica TaxID=1290095 RepID=A0ABV9YHV2_9PSEU
MIKKRWIAVAATTIVIPLTAAGAMASAAPVIPPTNPLKPVILCNNLQGGTCNGTPQSDTLIGGQLVDHIFGGAGDDDIEQNLIFLQGASDDAHGGPGRDCIDGGGGNSLQFGDDGDDNVPCEFTAFVDPEAALTSGPGDDTVHGGRGNDSMDGIFDSDTLYGDEGDDLINDPFLNDQDKEYGGPGNDVLNASDLGNDDIVDGGPGNDTCFGDPGDKFSNCERIYRVPVPLLVNPAGLPVPLPRALGFDPNTALPKLPAPTTS